MSQPVQPQNISVKEAERKAWKSVFQDGLWDIYLGLLLLTMGVSDLLDTLEFTKTRYYTIYFGCYAISLLVLWAGKRLITLPRLGRVKFGEPGKIRRKRVSLVLFVSAAVGLILWFLSSTFNKTGSERNISMDLIFPLIYVLNVLLVFGLGAYYFDYPRLYIIGVLFAVPVPLQILLRQYTDTNLGFYSFAVPAAIILVMGFIYLFRFLHKYQLPQKQTLNEMS